MIDTALVIAGLLAILGFACVFFANVFGSTYRVTGWAFRLEGIGGRIIGAAVLVALGVGALMLLRLL